MTSAVSHIKVMLVEDQPAIREQILSMLAQLPFVTVLGTAAGVQEATEMLRRTPPDVLLLDIVLKDGTAFEVLDRAMVKHGRIVFLTAYEEFAIKAIKYGALDYLLKPFSFDELRASLDKAMGSLPVHAQQLSVAKHQYEAIGDRIVLSALRQLHVVLFSDILYCHSHDGYTTFHLHQQRSIMMSKHLKVYVELLPERRFTRVHQSYLVNNDYIKQYERSGWLLLKDGSKIPVADSKKDSIIRLLRKNNHYATGSIIVTIGLLLGL